MIHWLPALALLAGILLVHRMGWWLACVGPPLLRSLLHLKGVVHPVQEWLRRRAPRAYALLHARLRTDRFSGLPLLLTAAAALYAASLAGGLVEALLENEELVRFDEAVQAGLAPWREGVPLRLFLWLTTLGDSAALGAVALVATGFLWADRRAALILPLWVCVLGSQATTWAGKFAFGRARPDFIEAASALSPSFPSAHATGAMAVYGFIAYAIVRDLGGRRARYEVAFWTAILVLLIGLSRMLLSVHFASDVASGFLVGAFWLLVGFALAEWRRGAP